MGEIVNAFRVLVGKLEMKRPIRSPRQRWEGNIKIVLKKIRWGRLG
jgi:hypothetical protein